MIELSQSSHHANHRAHACPVQIPGTWRYFCSMLTPLAFYITALCCGPSHGFNTNTSNSCQGDFYIEDYNGP